MAILEARLEQSILTFFYNKNRYFTLTGPSQTRASKLNSTQYHIPQAYYEYLKNSFFPRTIPQWNSLASSVVDVKTAEEFKARMV